MRKKKRQAAGTAAVDDLIVRKIHMVRGSKAILDVDIAGLYGVETKTLNRAVKRNVDRFPKDFMFQLTAKEFDALVLRCQIGTSKPENRGGRRYRPYAFTEQGVAMLSSVLSSPRAVQVNIAIMRAFVKVREVLANQTEFAYRLEELERKFQDHDGQITEIFEAFRQLLAPPERTARRIGYPA